MRTGFDIKIHPQRGFIPSPLVPPYPVPSPFFGTTLSSGPVVTLYVLRQGRCAQQRPLVELVAALERQFAGKDLFGIHRIEFIATIAELTVGLDPALLVNNVHHLIMTNTA